MDGTNHNITAYGDLGAALRPANLHEMKTSFPHPSDASFAVFAFPDPPHNIKLVRNALHHYGYFIWPGRGAVRWEYIANLAALQEEHGLRLGNKLTSKHANFQRNKMRVKLAVQVWSFYNFAFAIVVREESRHREKKGGSQVTARARERERRRYSM